VSTALPNLGPDERQLILNCARLDLDGPTLNHTREILEQPLAWDAVVFFAWFHSVAPLLYRHLKRLDGSSRIPIEVRRKLLQLFHRVGFRNCQYSKALQDLLDAFAEASIPVIVVKGISLVELIYGGLSLRPLIDLNLLIPEKERDRARDLLLRKEYVIWNRNPSQGRLFSQFHLVKRKGFKVDLLLQWHPVNWPRVLAMDLRRFWDEARPVQLSGRNTLIPSPVDLIPYLCLVPDRHGFPNAAALEIEDPRTFVFTEWTGNRLIRFTDIHEVIRHYQGAFDWEMLVERAKASGVEGSAYASLSWVTKLFGDTVEPWVLDALHPPPPRRLRKRLYEALSERSNNNLPHSAANSVVSDWWMKRRKRTQLRLVQLLQLLEFTFPHRRELRVLYRFPSDWGLSGIYALHVSKSLVTGVLPWICRVLVRRRPSKVLDSSRRS